MFRTRKFVSRKKPWAAELMQDKPINNTIMKKLFLLFSLLLGVLSAWAYDVEVDGIFYYLDKENKTASVTFGYYKGAVVIPETISVDGTAYSVTYLGYGCFSGCSGLTGITLPNSVTSFGNGCFSGCYGLTSITLPNSVTSLGNGCFSGCYGLTSITLPNSVTSLGERCFELCSGLTSITIPNSVNSLGVSCFSGCSGLESIVVESGNTVYDSRENCNAIIETATNTMHSGCKNTTIPNSVTSLGEWCFHGCTGLTSITLPNSVTSLGEWCFHGCTGLTSITLPNSVTSLGNGCFKDCSGLTSITLPNSVTSLGKWCFEDCSGLTSITIPNSVTSLGKWCFHGCTGLTEVHVNRETPPATGSGIFSLCRSLETIYVPTGASANYGIDPWNAYKIVEEDVQSGITAVTVEGETAVPVYHLNGSRAGTTKGFSTQPKGIYIVNGKKVLR